MLKFSSSPTSSPITVTELLQLTHLGIPLEHITWSRVTMTSDQWICIRHSDNSKSKNFSKGNIAITVLNPDHSLPKTWEATANSAQVNPIKPLIAVRADLVFQIYNIETRSCLHKYKMLQQVQYWTWINSRTLAFITEAAIFHWDLTKDESVPHCLVPCHPCVAGSQFVRYTTDEDMKWMALTGLTAEGKTVIGNTQIYSVEHNLSQPIQAHCVCFCQYKLEGNRKPSTLLVVANRGCDKTGKIHIVELGPPLSGNLATVSLSETVEFSDQWDQYDFPVSIQVSVKFGLVYVITKYGLLYLHDLETAAHLATHTICPDIVFTAALHQDTQGIIIISRNGQVLAVDAKKEALIKHVQIVLKKPRIAERLKKITWQDARL